MSQANIIPAEQIAAQIYIFREQKVMLDSDLAKLYGVTTGRLNEQVKRNIKRFPGDFAFQLNQEEFDSLISHIATSNAGRGGRRKPPWVFTEQGIAMLSGILHSERAIEVNISIMRTFVRLRHMLANNEELARKVNEHDYHIGKLYEELEKLLNLPTPPKNPIGFKTVKK